ncbi:MAG: L,D-transpeptidase family protein, partial [Terrimicrobiaceae bacterium]|nr:L,D-transpeptidase family protein [Terrimicrobiaceae bacterium]
EGEDTMAETAEELRIRLANYEMLLKATQERRQQAFQKTLRAPAQADKPEAVSARACLLIAALCWAFAGALAAQEAAEQPPPKKLKPASQLIQKQQPARVIPRVLERATPENVSIHVSLSRQRAYLKVGEDIAVDSPTSTGKRSGMTPTGNFTILEKNADHRSNLYGDFVSRKTGSVVRSGVSARIDSAPGGTVFRGAPMRWFQRLTWQGVGLHTGNLPGYPASHGCVRLPEDIARLFFEHTRVGTPVTISE